MDSIVKEFKDSSQYQRILEILEDYWLTEPEEEVVAVCMYFRKHDGQQQQKCIRWRNPKYPSNTPPTVVSMADVGDSKCDFWKENI